MRPASSIQLACISFLFLYPALARKACSSAFRGPGKPVPSYMQGAINISTTSVASQCTTCINQDERLPSVVSPDFADAQAMVCTVEKTGCTTLRTLLMHASGAWNYSDQFQQAPNPKTLALDIKKDRGYCWKGAKLPCTKEVSTESDQLHDQFKHAFGGPANIKRNQEVIKRSRQSVPGLSVPLIRAVQVRHPVARFVSGCRNKMIAKLGPDALASPTVVNWKQEALFALTEALKPPSGTLEETEAWLVNGTASAEWEQGGLKAAGWTPWHRNDSYSQVATGIVHKTSLDVVVAAAEAPADDEQLARSLQDATYDSVVWSPPATSLSHSHSHWPIPSSMTMSKPSAGAGSSTAASPMDARVSQWEEEEARRRQWEAGMQANQEQWQAKMEHEWQQWQDQHWNSQQQEQQQQEQQRQQTQSPLSTEEGQITAVEAPDVSGRQLESPEKAIQPGRPRWSYPQPAQLAAVARWLKERASKINAASTAGTRASETPAKLRGHAMRPRSSAAHRHALVTKLMAGNGPVSKLVSVPAPEWLIASQHYHVTGMGNRAVITAHYLRIAMCGDVKKAPPNGGVGAKPVTVQAAVACHLRSFVDGFTGRIGHTGSDVHFRLQRAVCQMDRVCYNHAIHLENFAEDVAAFFAMVPSLRDKGYGDPRAYTKARQGPVTHTKHFCSSLRLMGQPWAQRLVAMLWPDFQVLGYGCDALRWLWWASRLAAKTGLGGEDFTEAQADQLMKELPACDAIGNDLQQPVIAAVLLQCGLEPVVYVQSRDGIR